MVEMGTPDEETGSDDGNSPRDRTGSHPQGQLESCDVKTEHALERLKIWHDALKFYDQRRLQVLHYSMALIAGLILVPKLFTDAHALTDDQSSLIRQMSLSITLVIAIFCLGATYIYTLACYRVSGDIRDFEQQHLKNFLSGERGRHGMGGSVWDSIFVLFACFIVLACGLMWGVLVLPHLLARLFEV